MTRSARQIAVASLAALAAVAAIVAADFTAPAGAQSDDATGRIVARLLEDGRVEFGWQPAGGERVLPRQRYFPTNARVDRWLRSSPVEVGGEAIGRINARRLSSGRIEFAFTPTDGERILPPSRYFPADARVGRWLRSTEITIAPATPSYTAVATGYDHICAIRESDSAIECWGENEYGQTDSPDGRFTAISAGERHTCAIRESGEIACWGLDGWLGAHTGADGEMVITFIETALLDAPLGNYTAVSIYLAHACGLRDTGAIECWGQNRDGETDAPDGRYTAVSAGTTHSCAIRASDSAIECWGGGEQQRTNRCSGGELYRRQRDAYEHLRDPRHRRDRVLGMGPTRHREAKRPGGELYRRQRRLGAQLRDSRERRRDRVLGRRERADLSPEGELYRRQRQHQLRLRDP